MKRYIKNIMLLIAVAALSASCKKQLEEFNPAGATVQSLFTTPDGFEAGVNGIYTYNRSIYGKEEGMALTEMGTDLWDPAQQAGVSGTAGVYPQPAIMTYQGYDATNLWVKTNMWQNCYAAINLANECLKYIDKAGLTDSRKSVLLGEVSFLRAWYYWHLVQSFGDIPMPLEPTETQITTATRTPVDQIYTQIFADMGKAVANLPVTQVDYGRITKPASKAFMARLLLTRGRNQEALNYANDVIKNSGAKLLTNYADLWNMSNQRNSEVLWAVNYSTNLTYNAGSNLTHMLFLMDYATQPGMTRDIANDFPYVRYMPTTFLLNLYNEQDDSRYNASFKTVWLCNQPDASKRPAGMNVGDTAILISKNVIPPAQRAGKKYKIFDINDVYNSNSTPKDRTHYISLRKFDDPTRPTDGSTESSRDVFVFRLAELYLTGAEAELNQNKPDSAAYYINQLRSRAAIAGHQASMQVTAAQITEDFILDEWAREFAGEQMRWFVLKRAGKLVDRVRRFNPDIAGNVKDFHVLRPIPQAQIDQVTNKDQFKQNSGY